jgi:hypothetical protein
MRNAIVARQRSGMRAEAEGAPSSAGFAAGTRAFVRIFHLTSNFPVVLNVAVGLCRQERKSRAMSTVTRNFKQIESTSHAMRPGADLLARWFA